MNSSANADFENFNIFELAKNPDCSSLLSMVLENWSIYDSEINAQDEDGNTLLHLVVGHQDKYSLLQQVVALGPDVNLRNNINESPLYTACSKGYLKAVKLLLEKGANLQVKDTKLKSLLHVAVEKNKLELGKFLIDRGISVNCQDHNGSTPLHYAMELKLSKITFLLVHCKADINAQDYDGYTPLHMAATRSANQVNFLLRNSASTAIKTFNGDLPLHLAASSGNLEAVKVLLNDHGLNNLNNDDCTPMKLAEINEQEKVVQFLLGNSGKPANCGPSKIPQLAARTLHGNANSRNSLFSLPKKRRAIAF